MRPILTITLNPALDLSTEVEAVTAGPKLRCASPQVDPGGGGVNVSRVVAELGGTSTAFIAIGGATGQMFRARLGAEVTDVVEFAITGETRQSLSVVATATTEKFRFILPGPQWSDTQVSDALEAIKKSAKPNAYVVLSGSFPPGVPPDFAETLQRSIDDCDLILDLSGNALSQFVKARANAFLLRMDQSEGEALNGGSLDSVEETAVVARKMVDAKAAKNVIIAMGKKGSVLAYAQGVWSVNAANTMIKSTTGAGDSFVGAMTLALANNEPLKDAFQLGAAAASATVMTQATALCQREKVYELLPLCRVRQIAI
mgnify:CR=1 FL=1